MNKKQEAIYNKIVKKTSPWLKEAKWRKRNRDKLRHYQITMLKVIIPLRRFKGD